MWLRCGSLLVIVLGWFFGELWLISREFAEQNEASQIAAEYRQRPADWDDVRGDVQSDQPDELTTSSGYVFINGEYLPPPYHLQVVDDTIWVNGRKTTAKSPPLPPLPDDVCPENIAERERLLRVVRRWPRIPTNVQQLTDGNILIFFDGREPASFEFYCTGRKFLKSLSSTVVRKHFFSEDVRWQVPDEDIENLSVWLAEYDPPPDLLQRASAEVTQYEDELAGGIFRARAMYYLSQWRQPLNVSALVLVLAAVGHLWTSAPLPWRAIQGLHAWSRSSHPVGVSIVFVLVLSALDLVWTILMSQAGLMQEANPIAQHFINDPAQLTFFKSFFTFGSIGIFAVLRRCRPAQIGAWWACLICTLLAVRWLVFHTMAV